MTADTFATAMALLSVVAVGVALLVVVGRLAGRPAWVPGARTALVGALGIATVATLGSLALSEVFHFTPCRLCWWQRWAMYPLVPVLAVGAWRGDLRFRRAVVPVALVGAGIVVCVARAGPTRTRGAARRRGGRGGTHLDGPLAGQLPPSAWLEAEDWEFDVIVDSSEGELSPEGLDELVAAAQG